MQTYCITMQQHVIVIGLFVLQSKQHVCPIWRYTMAGQLN